MSPFHPAGHHHYIHRTGWLRAGVLGANDGIVSTASLVIGVAAASNSHSETLIAGIAALVAGAMSMAAGEFVSVSSQADTEAADLEREREALVANPEIETKELALLYEGRGLSPDLAWQVAEAFMAHDPLDAHARDELGITDMAAAQPLQAAVTSAISFAGGAALPLAAVVFSPMETLPWSVGSVSLGALALLGAGSAKMGGAGMLRAALRVTFWGAAAMGITGLIGGLIGTSI